MLFAKSARTKFSCFPLSNGTSEKRNDAEYYGTMGALSRQTALIFTPAWMHFWALFPQKIPRGKMLVDSTGFAIL